MANQYIMYQINYFNFLPFFRLTDFQLENEFTSCKTNIQNVLREIGFSDYIKSAASEFYQDASINPCKYYDTDGYNNITTNRQLKIIHINVRMM